MEPTDIKHETVLHVEGLSTMLGRLYQVYTYLKMSASAADLLLWKPESTGIENHFYNKCQIPKRGVRSERTSDDMTRGFQTKRQLMGQESRLSFSNGTSVNPSHVKWSPRDIKIHSYGVYEILFIMEKSWNQPICHLWGSDFNHHSTVTW